MPNLANILANKNPHQDLQSLKTIALLVPNSFSKGRIGIYKQLVANSKLAGCKLIPFNVDESSAKIPELTRILNYLDKINPCLVINASNMFLQFAARGKPLRLIGEKSYHFSSYTCCGSVYWLNCAQKTSIKLEDINKFKATNVTSSHASLTPCLNLYSDPLLVFKINHARWFLTRILNKCLLYTLAPKPIDGLKAYPEFSYQVCKTAADLAEFKVTASKAKIISLDIETSSTFISCIGYACLIENKSLLLGYEIITFVIPFFIPTSTGFTTPWHSHETEQLAWQTIREVHLNDSIKCMQNGANYDASYFIRYNCPLYNFTLDTLFLINSLWVELPKKIDFQASLFLPHSAYWKQELKAERDEKQESKSTALPRTLEAYQTYLKYNAKDCYYTLLVAIELLNEYQKPTHEFACKAYAIKLCLQLGPLLEANMRGFLMDKNFHDNLVTTWESEEVSYGMEFKYLTDSMPINIKSPMQVAKFIYGVMAIPPLPKIGRSTDKKHLKILQEISPIAKSVLEPLIGQKTSANNLSKYRNLLRLKPYGLFTYALNAAGTVTDRYAGSTNNFHTGTNPQNTPYDLRLAMTAPKGCFLVKFDYSQSDMYFTAFRLEDKKMMENVLAPEDTHCLHASEFFNEPYAKLAAATLAHEPWVVDNQTGVRSITKRIVYGANYGMFCFTLFLTMGFKALQFTAKKLKLPSRTFEDIISCANFLLNFYRTEIYPDQQASLDAEYILATKNQGFVENLQGAKRRFFGDLSKPARQRNIASYYGQNGTARNMNRAILTTYNNKKLTNDLKIRCLLQVHDELVYAIPYENLHEGIKGIQDIMLAPIQYKNYEFSVPTEPDIGLGYGKRLLGYTAELKSESTAQLLTRFKQLDESLLDKLKLRQQKSMLKFLNFAELQLAEDLNRGL